MGYCWQGPLLWVLMRYCPQGDVIVGSSGGIVGSSGAGKEGYGRNGRMANTAMLAYVPITKPLCQ